MWLQGCQSATGGIIKECCNTGRHTTPNNISWFYQGTPPTHKHTRPARYIRQQQFLMMKNDEEDIPLPLWIIVAFFSPHHSVRVYYTTIYQMMDALSIRTLSTPGGSSFAPTKTRERRIIVGPPPVNLIEDEQIGKGSQKYRPTRPHRETGGGGVDFLGWEKHNNARNYLRCVQLELNAGGFSLMTRHETTLIKRGGPSTSERAEGKMRNLSHLHHHHQTIYKGEKKRCTEIKP